MLILLSRDNDARSKFITLFTTSGLHQLINDIIRPNKKGGTCIDWIVTNSLFVRTSGVTNDYLSDHLSVYCVRKKAREKHEYVYRNVRDLTNYDVTNFQNILCGKNWDFIRTCDDMEHIWSVVYNRMYEVLAIMCPFKRFKQRKHVTPWMNGTIYRAMRERESFMRLFRQTGKCTARLKFSE